MQAKKSCISGLFSTFLLLFFLLLLLSSTSSSRAAFLSLLHNIWSKNVFVFTCAFLIKVAVHLFRTIILFTQLLYQQSQGVNAVVLTGLNTWYECSVCSWLTCMFQNCITNLLLLVQEVPSVLLWWYSSLYPCASIWRRLEQPGAI